MKLNKRTTTIILWAVSIGLLAGMVISFTPGLSMLGSGSSSRGPVEMTVNGQNVYEYDVQQARSNALFAAVTEGEVGADLKRLMVNQIVQQAVLQQAAARVNVSGGEVRQAVNQFREERGVAGGRNDRAYQNLIGSAGFTDQSFRDYLREQLRVGKFEDRLVGEVTVSDAEVDAYYQSHLTSYQTEERVVARQLVVDDEALAQELRKRAMNGEEFAALARQYSLDLADRDGAVGAASGETEPRPVGRPALPTAVANAAFALRGAGITDVVESNQRYFVVAVEQYLPAETRPFDEVADTVRQDTLAAKKAGIVEAELDKLREDAVLTFPSGSQLSFDNPVLAEVNGVQIHAVDLDAALYTNPQIQQALSPQTADLIVGLFKPTVLSQVIDTEVAYQAAADLGVPLVGTRAGVAQAALNYVGREASATEDEIERFYQDNLASFTLPPEAVVTQVEFGAQEQASAFREALLTGDELESAALAQGGSTSALGRVRPGELPVELDTALFGTQAFDALPGGVLDVSDVLVLQAPPADEAVDGAEEGADAAVDEAVDAPAGTELFVVLVAERTPERVRPLADVRAQVEASVLAQQRTAERTAWLAEKRSQADIVEHSLTADQFSFDGTAGAQAAEPAGAEQADQTNDAD